LSNNLKVFSRTEVTGHNRNARCLSRVIVQYIPDSSERITKGRNSWHRS